MTVAELKASIRVVMQTAIDETWQRPGVSGLSQDMIVQLQEFIEYFDEHGFTNEVPEYRMRCGIVSKVFEYLWTAKPDDIEHLMMRLVVAAIKSGEDFFNLRTDTGTEIEYYAAKKTLERKGPYQHLLFECLAEKYKTTTSAFMLLYQLQLEQLLQEKDQTAAQAIALDAEPSDLETQLFAKRMQESLLTTRIISEPLPEFDL